MLTLFTSPTCPKCRVIKAKLATTNIEYEISEDIAELDAYGVKSLPVAIDRTNGALLDFNGLVALTREARNEH